VARDRARDGRRGERGLLRDRDGRLRDRSRASTREPALYVLPLVARWVALEPPGAQPRPGGLLLAVALLTVAPWTARNYARYSAFVPVSTMGGRALFEGNADRTRGEVYAEYDEVGAEQGPIAQHRFAMREGLRAIQARQPAWLFEKVAQEVRTC
jgi:hypothetical protein